MPVRIKPTEQSLLWEIKKANDEVKRRETRYDKAVSVLTYWVDALKQSFPGTWEKIVKQEQETNESIERNNAAVDAANVMEGK